MDARAPDRTPQGWVTRHDGRRRALVRRDFADRFDRLGLLRAPDVDPRELASEARPFRPPGGRGPLALVPAGDLGEAVVRPYRRGGLPARLSDDRYLAGDRAFRELDLTLYFEAAGIPVATPLAAVQSSARPGYRAALVTLRVRDATPAARVLAGEPGGRRDALRRMGRSIRMLHGAGGFHPDLNVHNFLVPRSPGSPAVILDLDRVRRLPFPVPALVGRLNLRRLRRSLAKEGLDPTSADREALAAGYRDELEEGHGYTVATSGRGAPGDGGRRAAGDGDRGAPGDGDRGKARDGGRGAPGDGDRGTAGEGHRGKRGAGDPEEPGVD